MTAEKFDEITVTTEQARIIFSDLEDEIEILDATDYDVCRIGTDELTFYSKTKDLSDEKVKVAGANRSCKIKAQDIVWSKYSSNQPFWPAYVKMTTDNEVNLFYIFRSDFAETSPSHKKSTEDVLPFMKSTLCEITNTGLDHYREKGRWDLYDDFFKAVSMAKTYHLLKQQNHFISEITAFEFFNLSKPTMHALDFLSPPTTPQKNQVKIKNKSLSESKTRKRASSNSIIHCADYVPQKKSCEQVPDNFERLSQRVLEYILNGKCDHHIQKVLQYKATSTRMEYFLKDIRNFQDRKSWELINVNPYFRYINQQDDLMKYLRTILRQHQKRKKFKLPVTRFMQLLLHVLYPEAIIWATSKINGITYKAAENEYQVSHSQVAIHDDPAFERKLSASERRKIVWRTKALLDEIRLADQSF